MAIFSGSTAPSACYFGSTLVSAIYSGSTQLWPVSSGSAKLTISGPPGSFTGDGMSSETAFSQAGGFFLNDATGLSNYSWTATANATVYVSYEFNDDSDTGKVSKILIGSSSLFSTGMGSGIISKSFSVSPGNVVTISATGDPGQMFFFNVSIYAT